MLEGYIETDFLFSKVQAFIILNEVIVYNQSSLHASWFQSQSHEPARLSSLQHKHSQHLQFDANPAWG